MNGICGGICREMNDGENENDGKSGFERREGQKGLNTWGSRALASRLATVDPPVKAIWSRDGHVGKGMKMKERTPDSSVVIEKNGKAPFDFFLSCNISSKQDQSDVQFIR